jgi:hypothetical protein
MGEKEKSVCRDGKKKATSRPPLSSAAKRALAEAEARRRASSPPTTKPKEVNGAKGPEPTRYGDWEKKGIASDF